MLPLSDGELVLALRKRDGKQWDLSHRAYGSCPYWQKYLAKGLACPWCEAQFVREPVTRPLITAQPFRATIGRQPVIMNPYLYRKLDKAGFIDHDFLNDKQYQKRDQLPDRQERHP